MPRELGTAGLGEGRLIGFNIKKGRLEVHPGQQVRKLHRFLLYHLHRIGRPRSDSWGGGVGGGTPPSHTPTIDVGWGTLDHARRPRVAPGPGHGPNWLVDRGPPPEDDVGRGVGEG